MKHLALLIFAISSFCASANPSLTFRDGSRAELTWLKGPALVPEESILQLKWFSSAGQSARPIALPMVDFQMPQHGHGTSPVAVTETEPGTFIVSEIYFTMPGDWEISVTVSAPSGVEETQKLLLPLTKKVMGVCGK